MPTLNLGKVVGPQGPQGETGAVGPQGSPGPQGVSGANGITPNIQVGTVTTLDPDSSATVLRRAGSPDAAPVFDFGIPRGHDSVNDGDMRSAVYDPTGKAQDVFAYADSKTAAYAYSKQQSLKAATAAAYGLTSSAVPDDVLAKALTLITAAQTAANAKAVIYTGSYTGTGTSGPDHPNQITFPTAPKLVLMPRFLDINLNQNYNNTAFIAVNMADLTTDYVNGIGLGLGVSVTGNYFGPSAKKSSNGKTLYWYSHTASDTVASNASYQGNIKNMVYHWIAFA